jgi:hypothetical protein
MHKFMCIVRIRLKNQPFRPGAHRPICQDRVHSSRIAAADRVDFDISWRDEPLAGMPDRPSRSSGSGLQPVPRPPTTRSARLKTTEFRPVGFFKIAAMRESLSPEVAERVTPLFEVPPVPMGRRRPGSAATRAGSRMVSSRAGSQWSSPARRRLGLRPRAGPEQVRGIVLTAVLVAVMTVGTISFDDEELARNRRATQPDARRRRQPVECHYALEEPRLHQRSSWCSSLMSIPRRFADHFMAGQSTAHGAAMASRKPATTPTPLSPKPRPTASATTTQTNICTLNKNKTRASDHQRGAVPGPSALTW